MPKYRLLGCIASLFIVSVLSSVGQELAGCDYYINVENDAVRRYMNEVKYEPDSPSVIMNYWQGVTGRLDIPTPVVMLLPSLAEADTFRIVCYDAETLADSLTFRVASSAKKATLYNFIPGRTYAYKILVESPDTVITADSIAFGSRFDVNSLKAAPLLLQKGRIFTGGQVRMINVPGVVRNVRDLGGWVTEQGERVRYGRIFRGPELNGPNFTATDEGIALLRELGIGAEIDMRAWYNANNNISAFGFTNAAHTPSGEVPSYYYSSDSGQLPEHIEKYTWQYRWRMEFQFIVKNLRQGRAIYEHCVQGKDRTGYLSLLLEGLLGVPYDGMIKDYEMSQFHFKSDAKKDSIDKVIAYIETMEGETLRDKFETYFLKKMLVSKEDIDYFRSVMLEPEPKYAVQELYLYDLSLLIEVIAQGKPDRRFDLNGDGRVDIGDILFLLNASVASPDDKLTPPYVHSAFG